MDWLFTISAASAPRLLMRVVMVFDQQQLTLTALDMRCDHAAFTTGILIHMRCEEALARRIQAKLFHLQDILDVRLAAHTETATPSVERLSAFAAGGVCEPGQGRPGQGPRITSAAKAASIRSGLCQG